METGQATGAGPGGPEPDEDDLVGETEDGRVTVGVDRVLRSGRGGPAAGGHTTAGPDAAGSSTPGTSEGRAPHDQPGAGADDQT